MKGDWLKGEVRAKLLNKRFFQENVDVVNDDDDLVDEYECRIRDQRKLETHSKKTLNGLMFNMDQM